MATYDLKILLDECRKSSSASNLAALINFAVADDYLAALSDDIRDAINRVELDSPNLIFSLVEPVNLYYTNWNRNDSSKAKLANDLLIAAANRYTQEYEKLPFNMNGKELSFIIIASDRRRELLKKLTEDDRCDLALQLLRLVKEDQDATPTDPEIAANQEWLQDFISKIYDMYLENKTEEECKKYFEETVPDWNERIQLKMDTYEFIRKLYEVMSGDSVLELINEECSWYIRIKEMDLRESIVKELSIKYNNAIAGQYFDCFVGDLTYAYHEFIKANASTYLERDKNNDSLELPNATIGEFIIRLDHAVTSFMKATKDSFDDTQCASFIMRRALNIFNQIYWVPKYLTNTISDIISAYDTLDDGWFNIKYLRSIQMHLSNDPVYQEYIKNLSDPQEARFITKMDSYSYRDHIFKYLDDVYPCPDIVFDTPKIPATEASRASLNRREEELNAREAELAKREKKLQAASSRMSKKDQEYDDDHDFAEDTDEEEEEEPQKDLGYDIEAKQSTKGYKKNSTRVAKANRYIYKSYHKFKRNEQKVDSQIDKMVDAAKNAFTTGDRTDAIISGRRWTPTGLMKQALKTAAIFSFNKIAGIAYVVGNFAINKKRTEKQRREIIAEIDTEIKMLDEKIDDARGDGNREAKYALMRTRAELERTRQKIAYNMSASKGQLRSARDFLTGKRQSRDEAAL